MATGPRSSPRSRGADLGWVPREGSYADERVVVVITGEGLKTLDVVRGSFETYAIEPSVAGFEATVPEPAAASA